MRARPCLLFVLMFFLLPHVFSQSIRNIVKQRDVEIDSFIEAEMKTRKIPGLTLAICDAHGFVKQKAYGLADVQNEAPVRLQSVFELASLTKQFTAGAIMLLAQEGKLKLTDSIKIHLKDCPPAWNNITIRHLLTHTSGLPALGNGYSGLKALPSEDLNRILGSLYFRKEDSYRGVITDTLSFIPGSNWQYSDIGYLLLGIIIDNLTGSYKKYLQENIFDKTGMKNTYLVDQITMHPYEVRGYTLRDGELVNIRRVRDVEIPSHFGIFSNIQDLRKWDSILNTNSLFSHESKQMMWQNSILNSGRKTGYGFGWFTKQMANKTIVYHTGLTGTGIIKFVEDKVTFIVLTNMGGVAVNTDGRYETFNSSGLAFEIAEMLGYKNFIDSAYVTKDGHKIVTVKKELLEKLAGTYKTQNGQRRKITFEDGKIYFERGPLRTRIAPLNNGSFLMLGVINETILEPLSNGQSLRIKMGNTTLTKE